MSVNERRIILAKLKKTDRVEARFHHIYREVTTPSTAKMAPRVIMVIGATVFSSLDFCTLSALESMRKGRM